MADLPPAVKPGFPLAVGTVPGAITGHWTWVWVTKRTRAPTTSLAQPAKASLAMPPKRPSGSARRPLSA